MANGKFVAYYRVSTAAQGASSLGLEAQREAVRQYLNGGNWQMVEEVTEIESGGRNDRPALTDALRLCRLHDATLVIAKLDRLARNVHFISTLMETKTDFIAVDLPQANRLTIHILAAVAEHEALMISQRTKAALAAAKARGVKLGGNRGKLASVAMLGTCASAAVRRRKVEKRKADLLPAIETARAKGVHSLRGYAAYLNAQGIPGPRAGLWHANSVRRILTGPL